MNTRIKLRHLTCFIEVARHRSVSRAARTLFLTQAAVSKTIAELEEILATPLFDRGARGVTLNRFGEVFLRHAERASAALRQGEEAVAAAKTSDGARIRFGALSSAAARVVPSAVCDFMRDNPSLTARIMTGFNSSLLASLKAGELEFVIGRMARPKEMESLRFEHLYSERLALAVRPGHPLLKKRRGARADNMRILTEVGRHPVVSLPPETSAREDMDRLFLQSGATLPTRRVETDSVDIARGMTLDEDAVWCVRLGVIESDLRAGVLKEIPARMDSTRGAVGISTRADSRPSRHCAALMEKIRAAAGKIKET